MVTLDTFASNDCPPKRGPTPSGVEVEGAATLTAELRDVKIKIEMMSFASRILVPVGTWLSKHSVVVIH